MPEGGRPITGLEIADFPNSWPKLIILHTIIKKRLNEVGFGYLVYDKIALIRWWRTLTLLWLRLGGE